ncbi:MAG: glycosyltransferase family 4 protein [Betaproteobacteria bacterium]|nr:MAG: glycosyltransferase family 4 protein [Betaproteobacteria bacterium]
MCTALRGRASGASPSSWRSGCSRSAPSSFICTAAGSHGSTRQSAARWGGALFVFSLIGPHAWSSCPANGGPGSRGSPEIRVSSAFPTRFCRFPGGPHRTGRTSFCSSGASDGVKESSICLVCAGDGDREAVAKRAVQLGIDDAVRLTGWIGPSEKQLLLGSAAVFVLPSYAEGLPMSLLEAMAAGLPIVAAEVGGIPDVVTDGVNGFLFTPGDTAVLERLLCRLMHDPELSRRIASAARETVRLRFGADRVIAQLEEIYAGLGLAGAAGARARMPSRPQGEAA